MSLELPADGSVGLREVVGTLDDIDPERREATPVVQLFDSATRRNPTVAVEPDAFARIANFVGDDPTTADLAGVRAPAARALSVVGRRLTGRVSFSDVRYSGASDKTDDVALVLILNDADGASRRVSLAAVAPGASSVRVGADLPCRETCQVTGLTLSTPPALNVRGGFSVRSLRADGDVVGLGPASRWRAGSGASGGSVKPLPSTGRDHDSGLDAKFRATGTSPAPMSRTWVPDPVPALVTTSVPEEFMAPGVDAEQSMVSVGRLPRVPGAPPGARIVDLESLRRHGGSLTTRDTVAVWLRTDDAQLVDAVTAGLQQRGVRVVAVHRLRDVRRDLDQTSAAWSLQLAGLVGGVAILLAGLVLLVVSSTSAASRAADLASLRMSGVADRAVRRIETVQLVPVVTVSVLLGAVCGVLGAHYSLPSVRQFMTAPAVPTTDFSTPWGLALAMTGAIMVVLGLLAWTIGRRTARRARFTSVRGVV